MDRKGFLAEIGRLEGIIENQGQRIAELEAERDQSGEEAQAIGRASMEVREEDVAELVAYREQNQDLLSFVEKVADSKTKFRKEARKILGM